MAHPYFYVEVNGIRLRVYDSARNNRSYNEDNPVIILLHGSPGQISNWKHIIPCLEKHYRVIAFDQRGYGESDKPLKVSLEDYLEDLGQLIQKLNLRQDNIILVGHSFGGLVAQEYASRHRIRGLVLIGSLTRLRRSITNRIIWSTPPILWRKIFFTENTLTRRLYRKLFFSKHTRDQVYEEFIKDNKEYLENLPAHVFSYLKYFKDYDASVSVPNIRVPTLIIVGGEDKVTPVEEAQRLNEMIENSKLVVIENAGHMVLYEKPEELCEHILRFIEGCCRNNRQGES